MDQTDQLGNSHTYITIKHILVDLVSAPLFGDDDDTSSDDRLSFPFLLFRNPSHLRSHAVRL
jgi:hypothetical protein